MHTDRSFLTRFAWLSILAALATIGLKSFAYSLTGSVGLLSDAREALVNLAGALLALLVLIVAARPPDDEHTYGHSKAEYFSSGVEGALILVAAASIAVVATGRLLDPQPIQQLGVGLLVSVAASLINLGASLVLLRAARQHESVTLEANATHLMSDVWTSAAVLAGVGLVALTGQAWLDPVVALLAAAHIARSGLGIARKAVLGLMDTALPPEELAQIEEILAQYTGRNVRYHALRTRQSGARRFVSLHVLVPGDWDVRRGHNLLERIEGEIRAKLDNATVLTHLEALEDRASFEDQSLDRGDG